MLLILAIVPQLSGNLVIVACFQLNRSYIAQNLCEKRAEKDNQCNGHCYLSKKLKAQASNSERSSQKNPDKTAKSVDLSLIHHTVLAIETAPDYSGVLVVLDGGSKRCGHTLGVFHPPLV
jgi:hypothetical protein